MRGGFDYRQFKEWTEAVEMFEQQYEKFLNDFLYEMGLRAMAQTKKLTPVDTGNLRNRWQLSKVTRKGDYLIIALYNTAEYASFVEEGHRQTRRFLPGVLSSGKKGTKFTYVKGAKTGIMLRDKWIPGVHMARISITKNKS